MAQSGASPLLLTTLVLLLAIASPPAAHATFFFNNVQGLVVTGTLCCTQNGNCPGNPVVGATVSLSCKNFFGFSTVVGTNTTGVNGNFSITAPVATIGSLPLSLPIIPCAAIVQLPLSAAVCPVLSTTTNVLRGIIQSIGTANVPPLGLVQNGVVTVFFQSSF